MSKPTGKLLFAYNTITELNERIAELEKERFTFKKIISNPVMADQEKYVHIRDMLKKKK
jgi:hypothetical protein